MKHMRRTRQAGWFCLIFVGLLPTPLLCSEGSTDNRLYLEAVDMTAAGRKLTTPTPDSPVHYIPVWVGYEELGGDEKAFERRPSDGEIRRQLISMLAKQNYLIATGKTPPTMVLVFEWGSIVPQKFQRRDEPPFIANAGEIRAYVMGENSWRVDRFDAFYSELSSLTARHYLLISAFEYRKPSPKGEVLLWRAHVTTDLWGNYLAEVVSTMIAHAAPILGKKIVPGGSWSSRTPHVIVGKPEVVDERAISSETQKR